MFVYDPSPLSLTLFSIFSSYDSFVFNFHTCFFYELPTLSGTATFIYVSRSMRPMLLFLGSRYSKIVCFSPRRFWVMFEMVNIVCKNVAVLPKWLRNRTEKRKKYLPELLTLSDNKQCGDFIPPTTNVRR